MSWTNIVIDKVIAMDIPGWLLISLSVLSVLLFIFVLIFAVIVIKNCLRRRKYEQIRPHGKEASEALLAYFKGYDAINCNSIPTTFPAIMQTGSPLWMVSYGQGEGSNASTVSSTLVRRASFNSKVNDYRSSLVPNVGENYRKSPRSGSNAEMKKLKSPLGDILTGNSNSQKSSRSGSIAGDTNKTENFNRLLDEDCQHIYLHSDFIIDLDTSPPDAIPYGNDDPVISYDQPSFPAIGTLELGSLFFILEYDSNAPELMVTIKSGLNLLPVRDDESKTLNSYVNFCLVPEDFLWQRTNVVLNDTNPVYNETISIRDVLYHKLREYTLCFFVMDCTQPMFELVIGKVLYPLSDLRAEDKVEVCKELSPP